MVKVKNLANKQGRSPLFWRFGCFWGLFWK